MSAFEAIGFAFREQHESDYGIDAHVELIEGERATVPVARSPSKIRPELSHGVYWG